jgi:hypothetical protein
MEVLRSNAARVAGIALIVLAAWLARDPAYSEEVRARMASQFAFERTPLSPPDSSSDRTLRPVQPQLERIRAWISSVGAAVALGDFDGDGRSDDSCLVDTRTDAVTVAPVPATVGRFRAFDLVPPAVGRPDTTAPMGCLPSDVNEDGRTDFVVYYWGRTPVLFLRRSHGPMGADGYAVQELVGGRERWYTDSVSSADVDGDGHVDLIVGNYFPDGSRVLDERAADDPLMQMNDSMSRAENGGVDRVLLWQGASSGRRPRARFAEAPGALPDDVARRWTLAVGANDLTGDLLPELYLAHDFGEDALLLNRSTPGRVRFVELHGSRGFRTAASKVLGRDSFKGMGIDFGDIDADGRTDMVVTNITSNFALHESNFAWVRTGGELAPGEPAPFVDRSEPLGLARSGWGWDVKLGDFDNDSHQEIVQAMGFLRGSVDRWPELHELAMSNDTLLRHPAAWPEFRAGADLSGRDPTAFFVRGPSGRYANLGTRVGVADGAVSRGIATADVDDDGRLDMAIARQWGQSHFYRNRAPRPGAFLGLRLLLPRAGESATTRTLPSTAGVGRPAVGASATIMLPGGRRVEQQIDGGNGHASVRAPELLFGLGRRAESVAVRLAWRTSAGEVERTSLELRPGWHAVLLGSGMRRSR